MANWLAGNSLTVDLTGASHTDEVEINGTLLYQAFASSASGMLKILQDNGIANALVINGRLTSTGSLNISTNGIVDDSGTISARFNTNITTVGAGGGMTLDGTITNTARNSSVALNIGGTNGFVTNQLATIRAATVSITTNSGNLGTSLLPLNITAGTLALNAPGTVNVNVSSGTGLLTINPSSAGTSFALADPTNRVMLNGGISVVSGALSGALSITLQQANGIQASPGAFLAAQFIALSTGSGAFGNARQPLALNTGLLTIVTSGSVVLSNQQSMTLFGAQASSVSVVDNGSIFVQGSITNARTISLVSTADSGGTITFDGNIGNPLSTVTLSSDGSISASFPGSIISGSRVTVSSTNGDVGTVGAAINTAARTLTLSAPNGNVIVNNTGNVSLSATAGQAVSFGDLGSITTTNTITGSVVTLTTSVNQNITITRGIVAGGGAGNILLTAGGSGNIVETGGTITGNSLILSSGTGNIGSRIPVLTNVTSLNAVTAGGTLSLTNSGALTVLDTSASGNVQITSGGALTVSNGDSVTSANGGVTLVCTKGLLDVGQPAIITAGNGNVNLRDTDTTNGSIVLESSATIDASSRLANSGNVFIFIGTRAPARVAGPIPANVDITTSVPGQVFFGAAGIGTQAPDNSLNALGRNIVFGTGTLGASSILLNGNVTITADPPTCSPVSQVEPQESVCEQIVDTSEDI